MAKTVLITGASSGFGYACARMFARHGYQIIINGRRLDRLKALAAELSSEFGVDVCTLAFDVRDKQAVFSSINSIPEAFQQIDVLVNNAGLALGLSDLHQGDTTDWETMIDTNIKGILYVSKAVIPGMIKNGRGHIVNIGSVAGRETYLKGNVYCATKHAVESLSKGMRMELVEHNIKVTLVSPGAAETEFSMVRFKGDSQAAKNVYKGYQPLKAEDIALCVEFCVHLPEHMNINDMLVMPAAQASATIIKRKTE
jgi:3-hydroxy acid dehydrogenase / malonic semialdehyde reductase